MLREMRSKHGGPHLGTRALAVVLIALLGLPVTIGLGRLAAALLRTVV
jgi:hypothetical protein